MVGAVAQELRSPQSNVFGGAACHTFAPHPKGRGLHVPAHQGHYGRFVQSELDRDGLECGAVFPRHFDNA
jgi:hypothetical protein